MQWYFSPKGELNDIVLVSSNNYHYIHRLHYSNQGIYYCYGRDYVTNDFSIATVQLVVYG